MTQIPQVGFCKLYKMTFRNKKKPAVKNPLVDYKKFEWYASFVVALIVTVGVFFLISLSDDRALLKIALQNYTLYIAAALLGLLGFLVGGLAIITGTVSNKVAQCIDKVGAFNSLLGIMFSFYFEGVIIGVLILLYLLAYLAISAIPILWVLDFMWGKTILLFISLILSFGLSFAVCYAVSLLGTCINMFIINYNYSCMEIKRDSEFERLFLSYRIDALTTLFLEKDVSSQEEFLDKLLAVIDSDCPQDIRSDMNKRVKEYYQVK